MKKLTLAAMLTMSLVALSHAGYDQSIPTLPNELGDFVSATGQGYSSQPFGKCPIAIQEAITNFEKAEMKVKTKCDSLGGVVNWTGSISIPVEEGQCVDNIIDREWRHSFTKTGKCLAPAVKPSNPNEAAVGLMEVLQPVAPIQMAPVLQTVPATTSNSNSTAIAVMSPVPMNH